MIMVNIMMENGLKVNLLDEMATISENVMSQERDMEKENMYMLMGQNTQVHGITTEFMVKAQVGILMATSMSLRTLKYEEVIIFLLGTQVNGITAE